MYTWISLLVIITIVIILFRMYEFSEKFGSYVHLIQEQQSLALTELDVPRLGAIVKILKDTSHYHSSTFAEADMALLLKLLRSWPIAMIFPGESFWNFALLLFHFFEHEKNCQYLYCGNAVIDIIRMIVLHPDGAKLFIKHQEAENGMFYHIF